MSITTSGAVTGGTGAGISTYTPAGQMSQITLNAGTTVSAASGMAIVNRVGDSLTTVNAGAAVIGTITLGGGDDTLIFNGGNFSQVTLFDGDDFNQDGGTGGNFDSLTLGGSGTLNTDLLVNWDEINIGGNVAFSNNAFTFGQLTVASGGVLDTGTAFTFTGDLTLAFGGTLDSTGNSPGNTIIAGNLTNNGTITMFDGEANDSVTVTGNYTGNGALLIDTVLNDGVVDITDRLVINGNSAGTTAVTVNNVGGAGGDTDTGNPTTDGIQIVQVDGTSAGVFTLAAPVTAGAFTYSLVQADGQNWFLQSTGLLDQLFGYSALASAIHDQLEPLRQRDHRDQLVSLNGDISNSGSGFWSRVSYSDTEADASNSAGSVKIDSELEYERSKVQIGYDQTLKSNSAGTLIAGVFGHYQDLDLRTDDAITGAKQADAEAEGWGVGASLTYYASSGWYGDAMVQVTDYEIEVDGASGSKADTDALNWSVSIEGGYEFDLSSNLRITPQAQLLWQQTDFDNVTDSNGVTAKWGSDDSVTARVGMTLERDFMVANSAITGYVVTDVVHALTEAPGVSVNGVKVKSQINRTRLDLRVGGQHISANKQLVVYAELGASEALNSKDYQRIDATAGLRWRY
ncbi:MAG: autotransporter outer membrane beta-barrel domain-containing protein [Immundisolibacteraceae bacterium]|nr:autotransporter outer membrane beta-barrel domain-containing protein [Immundisolibacteraceae bacterium]